MKGNTEVERLEKESEREYVKKRVRESVCERKDRGGEDRERERERESM